MAAPLQHSHPASVRTIDADAWRSPLGIPADVDAFTLASPSCHRCGGRGAVRSFRHWRACSCVYRAVFRACLATYRHCQDTMGSIGGCAFERIGHAQGKCAITASFKRAEYAADFVLTGRRALMDYPVESAVFNSHLLAKHEWKVAVPEINFRLRLGRPLYRGSFFHAVYRAQEIVARAILSTHPYRLYPARDYFSGFILSASALIDPRTRVR